MDLSPIMVLQLSDEEQKFLLNILEQHHQELLKEISRTDNREFRQGLRSDEKVLDSLICRVQQLAPQELHT